MLNEKTEKKGDGLRWKRIQTKKLFIFQIIVRIRIHHQTTIRTLKFINWFIAESSCLRAREVLRTPDFALNFGSFQVADHETHFVDFLQIEAVYTTFSYLLIPNNGQDMRESDFWTVAAKFRFCSILSTLMLLIIIWSQNASYYRRLA